MDDAELRARLEAQHADSFGWALACCLGDAQKAADVLQTACLKVLQGRARYHGRSAFKTWFFAVVRNTAADEGRRSLLRRILLLDHAERSEPPVPVADPCAESVRGDSCRRLQQAMAALSARQREVLHLVFYQDLSIQEAAGVMGVSIGSARTHYERGKAQLRRRLGAADSIDETRLERRTT